MTNTIDNKINGGRETETKKSKILNCAEYMDKRRDGFRITEGFGLVQQAQPGSRIGSDYFEYN